jgi:hypothetical protein
MVALDAAAGPFQQPIGYDGLDGYDGLEGASEQTLW